MIIEEIFVEKNKHNNSKDDPFEISDSKTMIKYLKNKKSI